MSDIIPIERIANNIFLIRGQKVMLDRALAGLYGVKTKVLNQAVRRNKRRFPADFMFQLTKEEGVLLLRSQIVTLKNDAQFTSKRGKHIKYLPYAFTEPGISMLSSVLNSERAIDVNILIMRAFIKLREVLSTHKELVYKFRELEQRVGGHDGDIQAIFAAIKQMLLPRKKKMRVGFLREA